MTAGFGFEVKVGEGWEVHKPKLYKTERAAEKAAEKYVADVAAHGWETVARVFPVQRVSA